MHSPLIAFMKQYVANLLVFGFFLADRPQRIQRHIMHIVQTSPWPFLSAISVLFLLSTVISFFRYVPACSYFIVICLVLLLCILLLWGYDVIVEGSILRMHSMLMQRSFKFAILLFIISEIMFFFSFF